MSLEAIQGGGAGQPLRQAQAVSLGNAMHAAEEVEVIVDTHRAENYASSVALLAADPLVCQRTRRVLASQQHTRQPVFCIAEGSPGAVPLPARPASVNLSGIFLGIGLTVAAQVFIALVALRAKWLTNLQQRLQRINSHGQASTSAAALAGISSPLAKLALPAEATAKQKQTEAGSTAPQPDPAGDTVKLAFRDSGTAAVLVTRQAVAMPEEAAEGVWGAQSPKLISGSESTSSPAAGQDGLGESVEWVNMCFRKIWRVYQRGLERWIVDLLQPVFDGLVADGLLPRPLQRLRIVEFTLDHEAPTFSNMRRRMSRKDSDLCGVVDIRYTGGARMLLMIELGEGRWRLKIPVLVSDLDLEGKMWIKLRLAPMCPWIGQLSFAFVGPPNLKAQISPYNRVNLMRIPILQNLLRQLLTVDLPGLMVLPQRLEVNIPPALTTVAEAAVGRDTIMRAVASAVLQTDALEAALIAALPLGPQTAAGGVSLPEFFQGELTVGLREARNLPVWGLPWQSNPYCRVTLGDQALQSRREWDTSVKGRHGAPCWNQEMQFLVEDPDTQVLEIDVRDSHLTGRVEVGRARLALSVLPRDGHAQEMWMPLEPSVPGGESVGEVLLHVTYRPFEDDQHDSGYREAQAYAQALQGSMAITDIKSAAAASSRAAVAASAAANAIAMTKAAAARAAARASRTAKAAAAAATTSVVQLPKAAVHLLQPQDATMFLPGGQMDHTDSGGSSYGASNGNGSSGTGRDYGLPAARTAQEVSDAWALGPEYEAKEYAVQVEAVDRVLAELYTPEPCPDGGTRLVPTGRDVTALTEALPLPVVVPTEMPPSLPTTTSSAAGPSPEGSAVTGGFMDAAQLQAVSTAVASDAAEVVEEDRAALHMVSSTSLVLVKDDRQQGEAAQAQAAAAAAAAAVATQQSWWGWWQKVKPIWPATNSLDHAVPEDVAAAQGAPAQLPASSTRQQQQQEQRAEVAAQLPEQQHQQSLSATASNAPGGSWWSFLWPFRSKPSTEAPPPAADAQSGAQSGSSEAATNAAPEPPEKTDKKPAELTISDSTAEAPPAQPSSPWWSFIPFLGPSSPKNPPQAAAVDSSSPPAAPPPSPAEQVPLGEIQIPPDLPLEEIAKELAKMKEDMWNSKVDHVQSLWVRTVEKNDRSWLVLLTVLASIAVGLLTIVVYRLDHLPM